MSNCGDECAILNLFNGETIYVPNQHWENQSFYYELINGQEIWKRSNILSQPRSLSIPDCQTRLQFPQWLPRIPWSFDISFKIKAPSSRWEYIEFGHPLYPLHVKQRGLHQWFPKAHRSTTERWILGIILCFLDQLSHAWQKMLLEF